MLNCVFLNYFFWFWTFLLISNFFPLILLFRIFENKKPKGCWSTNNQIKNIRLVLKFSNQVKKRWNKKIHFTVNWSSLNQLTKGYLPLRSIRIEDSHQVGNGIDFRSIIPVEKMHEWRNLIFSNFTLSVYSNVCGYVCAIIYFKIALILAKPIVGIPYYRKTILFNVSTRISLAGIVLQMLIKLIYLAFNLHAQIFSIPLLHYFLIFRFLHFFIDVLLYEDYKYVHIWNIFRI